jgi:hypothetical protein
MTRRIIFFASVGKFDLQVLVLQGESLRRGNVIDPSIHAFHELLSAGSLPYRIDPTYANQEELF